MYNYYWASVNVSFFKKILCCSSLQNVCISWRSDEQHYIALKKTYLYLENKCSNIENLKNPLYALTFFHLSIK
jgi:hypothetical protein